ncbi:MAG: glycerol-3-phosphate 1-O-acyltransferase PlsY [Planctomycetes bacterium]|nr:glycerol-3-phosphate 1-O-acyltransferase PlsY [Planctomycetota bacterium]MBU1518992.1 glycerol-3-phosphate 1-O-acyltransferase PlsY [Planctomycetota bacterium]MBU2457448.1 glycerol-3-phosphate 1-O-acyltransferase PlsY [Planctomycetota bacterium]MBU2597498.1 glycerol-3-phosphate 1-O-acyltransferase PlsY [Planctomycetota bacterium]
MKVVILIIVSYLVGSISFAWIIAKAHGIDDLRTIGSGNLGTTNLARACGKKWSYPCFLFDVLKGFIPSFAAKFLIISESITPATLSLWLAVGIAAILGHIFPFYLKFKGGKGVATSFGVALGIWPYYTIPCIAAFVLWAVIVLIWKYISLASVIAAAVFPILIIILTSVLDNWHFNILWPLILMAIVLCSLVIFLHRANIKRLLAGTEHKVLQKPPKPSA